MWMIPLLYNYVPAWLSALKYAESCHLLTQLPRTPREDSGSLLRLIPEVFSLFLPQSCYPYPYDRPMVVMEGKSVMPIIYIRLDSEDIDTKCVMTSYPQSWLSALTGYKPGVQYVKLEYWNCKKHCHTSHIFLVDFCIVLSDACRASKILDTMWTPDMKVSTMIIIKRYNYQR